MSSFNREGFKCNQADNGFSGTALTISCVTKVTKGGCNFRFAAVVVIGDKKGHVGLGTGKANEVSDSVKKAMKEAKKSLVEVPLVGTTVPYQAMGCFGAGLLRIKPAKKGTGFIARGPVCAVIELAGLADVCTKSLGSNTPINMIRTTLEGLKSLQTVHQVAKLHGKTIEKLQG